MARPGTFDRTTVADGWFDPTAQPIGWACEDGLQDAPALNSYSLDAQPGAFAVTGADAGVVRGLALDAQPVAFLLTGADAGLVKTNVYLLDAQPGAFALSGAESGLVWSGEPVVEVEAGQTPAGRKLKSRKERRWRVIGDRAYLVNDRELVDLLADLVEEQPVPEKVRQQPVKRPQKRQQEPERITLPAAVETGVEARFEALQHEFTIRADLSLLDALAAAMARIELDNEEEELMLLLA